MKKTLVTLIACLTLIYSHAQVQLYGVTSYGGASGGSSGIGTIFHYTPSTTSHVVDQSFIYTTPQGGAEYGAFTDGGNNKFYAMASSYGRFDKGSIFEWDPQTNITTKKIDFDGVNGANPQSSLTLNNGKFYGMTTYGGTNNMGVMFEWDPATNVYSKKIDFNGTNGSANGTPNGALVFYNDKFYGTTSSGGLNNMGVIFQWDPVTNLYTKKIDFDGINGLTPYGSLTLKAGKFYGMTYYGGANSSGVIFEWDPITNIFTKRIDMTEAKGGMAYGSLVLSNGKFYGLASNGGANLKGVIFEWDPSTNIYTDKFDFNGSNGWTPVGSFIASGNKLYGMTRSGGASGGGVIFEWDPVTNTFVQKINFGGSNGDGPNGSLTLRAGIFYGMNSGGGGFDFNEGVIFEWDPVTNIYTKKLNFQSTNGSVPIGSLSVNGNKLYGITSSGGVENDGVIFEWDPATGTYTKKFDFSYLTSGVSPEGSLTLQDGKFYGVTSGGGAFGNTYMAGVIFEWDPVTNIYTKKIDLNETTGWGCSGSLIFYKGDFYGVAPLGGGSGGRGVIFKWNPVTNVYTVKFTFDGGVNGGVPSNSLALRGGKFYGIALQGGSNERGAIFEWDPVTDIYTKKIDFDGINGAGSAYAIGGSLTLINDKFYGMTTKGGTNYVGVIFEWDPTTNVYKKKVDFDGINGSNPYGALTFSEGKFYGMTYNGGLGDTGVLFEWDPATNVYTKVIDFNGTNGNYPYGNLVEFSPVPLPVTLLGFNAQKQNKAVQLSWQTTNELNTSHFMVQRGANDIAFSSVGSVESKNTSGNNSYSLTDNNPINGTNFYRLQMADKDGKTTYSPVVKITFSGKTELQAFPNPAKDIITLSGLENKGIIKIISPEGKLVKQLNADANSITIDISTLAKGMYLVQYNNGEKTSQLKFIKR